VNSKAKGKRGELDFVHELSKLFGLIARRTAQVDGKLTADIIIDGQPTIHPEIKRYKRLSVYTFMDQAVRDAGDKLPVVFMRGDRREWLVMLRLEDLSRFEHEQLRQPPAVRDAAPSPRSEGDPLEPGAASPD
jgi:hypothetical protein